MKKVYLVSFIALALLFLAACGNEDQRDTAQAETPNVPMQTESATDLIEADDDHFLPAWIRELFSEEELMSGDMLTSHTSVDESEYHSLDDLIEFGLVNIVVKAEVLDERVEWLDYTIPFSEEQSIYFFGEVREHEPRPELFTVHRLRVLDVFKGDVEVGDVVEVAQRGGQIENFISYAIYLRPLSVGDILVFFLRDPNLDPARENFPVTLPLNLVNSLQGIYRLPAPSDGIVAFSADETLEGVPDQLAPSLTLTLDDLANMQRENFGHVSESFGAMLAE